jgi:predicted metal-dependent hydrolase
MKNKITHRSVYISGREISYEWIRKKVKNINLRVRGDGTVTVSSPHVVSASHIEAFLTEKAFFLFRALDEVEKRKKSTPPPLTFCEGETVFLLGEPKLLQFSPLPDYNILEKENVLVLPIREDEEKTKKLLRVHAEKKIKIVITDLCKKAHPLFPQVKTFPTIRFRAMRATWGNCRPKENILTFNTRLASYPIPCIEYIVMHEFTHLLVPNHSEAFYATLAQKMPDWKERKQCLNTTQIKSFF